MKNILLETRYQEESDVRIIAARMTYVNDPESSIAALYVIPFNDDDERYIALSEETESRCDSEEARLTLANVFLCAAQFIENNIERIKQHADDFSMMLQNINGELHVADRNKLN